MSAIAPVTQEDITNSWIGQIPVGQVVAFVIVVVGFGTVLYALWRKLRPLENFFKDWNGEPARPGVEPRPGVMPRLSAIESHLADTPTRFEVEAIATDVTNLRNGMTADVASLREKVAANTAVIDLVRPHVVVDLPKGQP